MPGKIVGNVHWIRDGQQTQRVVDAEAAFSDPVQQGNKSFLQKLRAIESRSGS